MTKETCLNKTLNSTELFTDGPYIRERDWLRLRDYKGEMFFGKYVESVIGNDRKGPGDPLLHSPFGKHFKKRYGYTLLTPLQCQRNLKEVSGEMSGTPTESFFNPKGPKCGLRMNDWKLGIMKRWKCNKDIFAINLFLKSSHRPVKVTSKR